MPKSTKFPNYIIPVDNPEKAFHEEVDAKDFANCAHPSRLIFCGIPNSGKTLVILNLLTHKKPPFEKIYLIHNNPYTTEYQDVDYELLEEGLPEIEDIDCSKKNLIIIEDVDYKTMSKEQRSLLDRYYGCFSTHNSVSIWLTAQDAISIPPSVRRMANIIFVWKSTDVTHMSLLSSRFGLNTKELKLIFDYYLTDLHDSLIIDGSRPYARFRKNIFEVLPIKY